MRSAGLAATLITILSVVSPAASAQVNYGDFIGANFDFLQVTETTNTPGDPAVLWGAPLLDGGGNGLQFSPPDFTSSCSAGSSDITSSLLSATIMAQPFNTIQTVSFLENGDVTLAEDPPFGDPATGAFTSISGFLTVIEDSSGPITPVVISLLGTIVPTDTFGLPDDFGTTLWSGSFTVDVEAVVPNATKAVLQLDNTLVSACGAGNTSARIQKRAVNGPSLGFIVGGCGNGMIDGDESCDAPDLGGASCGDVGCSAGTPQCTDSCTLDYGLCSSCAVCDGDGVCEQGEDCGGCPSDCLTGAGASCGDGICQAADGEDCVSCPADCNGKQGGRQSKRFCCGDGGGENPVSCSDSRCTKSDRKSDFQCVDEPTLASCCGDGWCDPGEDSCSCATDCLTPPGTELSCTNGVDDDCDSSVDCNDGDCSGDPACTASCGEKRASCNSDGDCCSGNCSRRGTCR
jgi:hypothetical protein